MLAQSVRFQPLVTSSAIVELGADGTPDYARSTVVGGFKSNSTTFIAFFLDPR